MYIIRSDTRNAYLTYDGWTHIHSGIITGLHNVVRFTSGEVALNEGNLPSGQRFVHFPIRKWRDL